MSANFFFIDGRQSSTKEITKRFTSSIDVFKFKKLFIPILESGHFLCMDVYMNEKRIALYDSMFTKKKHVHYLVLMFCFLVDKHAAKKRGLCCVEIGH